MSRLFWTTLLLFRKYPMTEAGRTVCVGPPPPYNEGQREATAVRSFNLNPSAPISRPEVVAPSSGSGSKSVRRVRSEMFGPFYMPNSLVLVNFLGDRKGVLLRYKDLSRSTSNLIVFIVTHWQLCIDKTETLHLLPRFACKYILERLTSQNMLPKNLWYDYIIGGLRDSTWTSFF